MNSIITETGLSKKSAKEVTEFVVRRIIASGIKFLSGPHIRELVCSALSEMHFEEERKKFTRIGMPINDYENLLKSRFNERTMEYTAPENIHRWASGQLSTEYTLLKILTNEQTREHLMGNIHIHSLNYFDMRPFAQAWDLRMVYKYGFPPASFLNFTKAKPANNAMTAVLHTCKWLGFAHSEFSGEQNCLYINTLLSPFLKGLEYKNIKQLAQTLIFEINQQYITQGSHVPITSITTSPTIPKVLKNVDAIGPAGKIVGVYGDYEKENQLLFNAISEVYNEGDENGKFLHFLSILF
jgi:ribonucleoside-triphosphate reductase